MENVVACQHRNTDSLLVVSVVAVVGLRAENMQTHGDYVNRVGALLLLIIAVVVLFPQVESLKWCVDLYEVKFTRGEGVQSTAVNTEKPNVRDSCW